MAAAAPLFAAPEPDELIISPELVLVDPELAVLARAQLYDPPTPLPVRAVPPVAAPEPPAADEPAAAGAGIWLLTALCAVSLALNVLVLRYAWEDGISPQQALGLASSPTPPVPASTAPDIQASVLNALPSEPALRRRFVDSNGILLPGVSARCNPTAPATFSCVVWRAPGTPGTGTSVTVNVLPGGRLGFSRAE